MRRSSFKSLIRRYHKLTAKSLVAYFAINEELNDESDFLDKGDPDNPENCCK